MGRTPCCDKSKVKRGPWSPEEDAVLMNYLQIHGTGGNWISLPQRAGLKRCGKSCRLRWLNYLRPDIKHGCFTDEEDTIILSLYNSLGSRWSVIASKLAGRTDNDVKNRWNTKLKKKFMAASNNYHSTKYTALDQQASIQFPGAALLLPEFEEEYKPEFSNSLAHDNPPTVHMMTPSINQGLSNMIDSHDDDDQASNSSVAAAENYNHNVLLMSGSPSGANYGMKSDGLFSGMDFVGDFTGGFWADDQESTGLEDVLFS